jgi:Aminoglycoside-2''-adenylyltransferase
VALSDLSDIDFTELYGAWAPHTPQDAAELLDGYGGSWWVVGGWAAQAFTGVTRPHDDVDIAIRRGDLGQFREHLAGRTHIWRNDGGTLSPVLDDDPDAKYPKDFLQLWLRRNAALPWEYDVICDPGDPGQWINRRLPSMTLPLNKATWLDPQGIRYLNPEILLLFKARDARPKDEADFAEIAPLLSEHRRTWLRETMAQVHLGHPWLDQLDRLWR